MYGHLLPFLNQRPLSASTGPQSWTEQLPVPVAGDRSFALCVEAERPLCFWFYLVWSLAMPAGGAP